MKKRIVVLILALVCLTATAAWAGLSVRPSVIEKVVVPGHVYKGTYLVANNGSQSLKVTVEPEDWLRRLSGGAGENLNVEDWFAVEPAHFELAPRQMRAVRYTIRAPYGMAGEKAAQVFFSFSEQQGIQSRLGVVIYICSKGIWRLDARVKEIQVANQTTGDGKKMVVASAEVENLSNVHIRPLGVLTVLKGNKRVEELQFNRSPAIFPKQSFQLMSKARKDTQLEPGTYVADLILDYGYTYGEDRKLERRVPFEVKK